MSCSRTICYQPPLRRAKLQQLFSNHVQQARQRQTASPLPAHTNIFRFASSIVCHLSDLHALSPVSESLSYATSSPISLCTLSIATPVSPKERERREHRGCSECLSSLKGSVISRWDPGVLPNSDMPPHMLPLCKTLSEPYPVSSSDVSVSLCATLFNWMVKAGAKVCVGTQGSAHTAPHRPSPLLFASPHQTRSFWPMGPIGDGVLSQPSLPYSNCPESPSRHDT